MIEKLAQYTERHPGQVGLGAIAVGVGVVTLYNKLRPERHYDPGENYFDIIANLDQCIIEGVGQEVSYVMLGGGASAALAENGTIIDFENRLIKPPVGIKKAQYREDTGTLADMDILVMSDEEKVVEAVRAALSPNQSVIDSGTPAERARELVKPGAKLKVGVTGMRSGTEYDQEPKTFKDHLVRAITKDWVSHRLQYPEGSHFFVISDISVELPDEYFEPWQMVLNNGESIPVFHPLTQVLCYLSRASHGIRRRDIDKVTKIMGKIGREFGARLEWGHKNQTARLVVEQPVDDGVVAAIDFADQKNALRWKHTKERLGKGEAALLAARIALHRQLDTRKFFTQFGQDGWLYDNVISRFSGERQQKIKHLPKARAA